MEESKFENISFPFVKNVKPILAIDEIMCVKPAELHKMYYNVARKMSDEFRREHVHVLTNKDIHTITKDGISNN